MEILKFDPSATNTWTVFAQMTEKEGRKLEVSTIDNRMQIRKAVNIEKDLS